VLTDSDIAELDEYLEHHGVKGMKWGIRNKDTRPHPFFGKDGKRIKGRKKPTSTDAINAAKLKKLANKKGTGALDNQELQALVTRLNLEQQYSNLTNKKSAGAKIKKAHNVVKGVLGAGKTVNDAITFAQSPSGQYLAKNLKKKLNRAV
jgi:hypothetical protein